MQLSNRIAVDPAILDGQAHIRGTRVTVRNIVENLKQHRDCRRLLAAYPELEADDMRDAVAFAAEHAFALEPAQR